MEERGWKLGAGRLVSIPGGEVMAWASSSNSSVDLETSGWVPETPFQGEPAEFVVG